MLFSSKSAKKILEKSSDRELSRCFWERMRLFNEAISGGEREYEIERIKERILAKGQTFEQFKWFLDYAEGGLRLSSGFGIGIERLIRYICGFERIEETHPFPKTPGKFSI